MCTDKIVFLPKVNMRQSKTENNIGQRLSIKITDVAIFIQYSALEHLITNNQLNIWFKCFFMS